MVEEPVRGLAEEPLDAAREALIVRISTGDLDALDELVTLRGGRVLPGGSVEVIRGPDEPRAIGSPA